MTWISDHWTELAATGAAVGTAVLGFVAWGGRLLALVRKIRVVEPPDTTQQLLALIQHMGEEQSRQSQHLATEIEHLRGVIANQERRICELEHTLEVRERELQLHQDWCSQCPNRPGWRDYEEH